MSQEEGSLMWEIIVSVILSKKSIYVYMKPSDFYDAPIGNVLHFIRSVGLIKG
jgi:hypothetical protein